MSEKRKKSKEKSRVGNQSSGKISRDTLDIYLKSRKASWLSCDNGVCPKADKGSLIPIINEDKASKLHLNSESGKLVATNLGVSGDLSEKDLKLERRLAKKLRVKKGKLPGFDDGLNLLFSFPGDGESLDVDQGSRGCLDRKFPSKETKKRKKTGGDEEKIPRKEFRLEKESEEDASMKKDSSDSEIDGEIASWAGAEGSILTKIADDKHLRLTCSDSTGKDVALQFKSPGVDNQDLLQIRRRVRGLLNQLCEGNLEHVTGEMASILRSAKHSIGSKIIGEQLLRICGNEQFAAVFAAFIAGLASFVGVEFSANFFSCFAKSFEEAYARDDKGLLQSLSLLLSYLYMFGVCSSDLVFDFFAMSSKRLTGSDASNILIILQCCGMKLRADDPIAMKDSILNIQSRVNELKSFGEGKGHTSNKIHLMLQTLLDIKNNKGRPKEDIMRREQIKKWLKKIRGNNIILAAVKWSKLLDPHKSGQWWLSGDNALEAVNIEEVAGIIDREVLEAQNMLQLASVQRMNTEARKAIFCIIMSGEDYIDAFEKLSRLDLTGKQDREIIRVLVECCLMEKVFNKYYSILASKLCEHDKNHKFTLQYCLWDHFKQLDSMPLIKSMHLSRFTAEMIASFSLSLAVLKIVDLGNNRSLSARKIMHFRLIFESLLEFPDKIVWNVFTRIAVAPEFENLRNGIELFINMYVGKDKESVHHRSKIMKKALNNVDGVLM